MGWDRHWLWPASCPPGGQAVQGLRVVAQGLPSGPGPAVRTPGWLPAPWAPVPVGVLDTFLLPASVLLVLKDRSEIEAAAAAASGPDCGSRQDGDGGKRTQALQPAGGRGPPRIRPHPGLAPSPAAGTPSRQGPCEGLSRQTLNTHLQRRVAGSPRRPFICQQRWLTLSRVDLPKQTLSCLTEDSSWTKY